MKVFSGKKLNRKTQVIVGNVYNLKDNSPFLLPINIRPEILERKIIKNQFYIEPAIGDDLYFDVIGFGHMSVYIKLNDIQFGDSIVLDIYLAEAPLIFRN